MRPLVWTTSKITNTKVHTPSNNSPKSRPSGVSDELSEKRKNQRDKLLKIFAEVSSWSQFAPHSKGSGPDLLIITLDHILLYEEAPQPLSQKGLLRSLKLLMPRPPNTPSHLIKCPPQQDESQGPPCSKNLTPQLSIDKSWEVNCPNTIPHPRSPFNPKPFFSKL